MPFRPVNFRKREKGISETYEVLLIPFQYYNVCIAVSFFTGCFDPIGNKFWNFRVHPFTLR